MAARPGSLKSGRKILRSNVPISSINPKSVRSGSKNGAIKKITNNTGIRSFRITPPVVSETSHAGPICNRTAPEASAAVIRLTSVKRPTTNRDHTGCSANLLPIVKKPPRLAKTCMTTVASIEIKMTTVARSGRLALSFSWMSVERIPIPILMESRNGTGSSKAVTPSTDGITNRA